MNGHTEMPAISISTEAGYSMMHSILHSWSCRIWLASTPVILVAEWMGEGADDTETSLLGWNDATGRYDRPMVIPTDDIRRVEIM